MYYWAMKKRKTSLIFLTVSVILLFLLGQAANAQKKDVKSTARIELSGGQTKTFSSPLRINGKFKTENFTISHLPIETVKSFVFEEKQNGENTFLLKIRGAKKAIRGSFSGDAELTGSGEWGKETVAMSKIKSIQFTNAGDTKPFKPESKWQCTFTNGEQLAIGWTSKWARDREFSGRIGDGSLSLDVLQVAKLTRSGDSWTIISSDGFSLEGWQPKKKSLSAGSLFGGLELSWSKVAKLSNESAASGDLGKKPKTIHSKDWQVEIGGRFVLPVSEMQTGKKAMINGELNIKSLNWQFIDSTSPKPKGLQLNFSNNKSWMLQGTISGNSPIGKVEVSIQHVTKFVRLTPFPKNRVPSDYNKSIVATITTASGSEYPVGDPSLEGGPEVDDDKDFFGYGLFRVSIPPVEMWVSSKSLLSGKLSTADGKLVSHSHKLARRGPLGGFKGIAFSNPGGRFVLPVTKLAEYSPQASPSQSRTSASQKPKYRVLVIDQAGKEFTGKVSDIDQEGIG
jgi:hypothetical protein